MGWWKVENTELIIGDLPLERIGEALDDVLSLYQEEFGRIPTLKELEALFETELGISLRKGDQPPLSISVRILIQGDR